MSDQERRAKVIDTIDSENRERLIVNLQRRLKSRAEAEDVYQETVEEFIEKYDLGVAIESMGAWLMRVALNKVIDRFRRRGHFERYQEEYFFENGDQQTSDSEGPENQASASELRELISEALELLPTEQREVFVKHELEGKSYEQISIETGVGMNTLLSRKKYAIEFLRDFLKEVYDDYNE